MEHEYFRHVLAEEAGSGREQAADAALMQSAFALVGMERDGVSSRPWRLAAFESVSGRYKSIQAPKCREMSCPKAKLESSKIIKELAQKLWFLQPFKLDLQKAQDVWQKWRSRAGAAVDEKQTSAMDTTVAQEMAPPMPQSWRRPVNAPEPLRRHLDQRLRRQYATNLQSAPNGVAAVGGVPAPARHGHPYPRAPPPPQSSAPRLQRPPADDPWPRRQQFKRRAGDDVDGQDDMAMDTGPDNGSGAGSAFITAAEQLARDAKKRHKSMNGSSNNAGPAYGTRSSYGGSSTTARRTNSGGGGLSGGGRPPGLSRALGNTRRPASAPFNTPFRGNENEGGQQARKQPDKEVDEASSKFLKNVDEAMVERIRSEIMESNPNVTWDDIAGLKLAKKAIQEMVIWPMLRPDLFTGLRAMPKGVLLFGPPGTGKTLIGKCIASQSKSTFFSISASSLTSKWIGEGEKTVRALFAVARECSPSVIFIDEIDSLLTQRSDTEHESSRRIKTEFLVQLDGATTSKEERLLIVGATNRPQELDEAARRRLVRRLYIPLPDYDARREIIRNLLKGHKSNLTEEQIDDICHQSEGYSGADMTDLCKAAAVNPMREIMDISTISAADVRPIDMKDFETALKQVRASVSSSEISSYIEWNKQFGSHSSA